MDEIPRQIGPYRVLQILGTGGMGEVLLAHDERLDRRVAVKRIRREASSPDQRERFRREARLAARLSHSAIVQVHDLVTEGEVDNLVMEYVEGTTLRELSRRGPLPVSEALDLGVQIAQGLREAHRHGIVHRDLKTENVLVTPEGQAKIADFGVAKRLADAWNEESLTRTDAIVGTYRTMSPEQARGGPVDHRSDLFAFGVLLYEILAGQSPFQGENPLATLDRIVNHRQTPLREVDPAVPDELSRLVDRLLEKEPALRPRSAGEVVKELQEIAGEGPEETGTATWIETPPAAPWKPRRSRSRVLAAGVFLVLLALAAGAYLLLRGGEPLYVAVLEPEVEAGDLELLRAAVGAAVLRGLLSLEGLSVKAAGSGGEPAAVARALAADEVVACRLDCRPGSCRVSLSRLRGEDGSTLWISSFEIPTDDLFLVSNAVASQARKGYPRHRVRPGSPRLEAGAADLREYLVLRRQLAQRSASLTSIRERLGALRARAPRFLEALLLEAEVARLLFYESRDPADLEPAYGLIRRARGLAPEDPQPVIVLADLALAENDLERAEEALAELERLAPGDVNLLDRRAFLLRRRGRMDEAVALLRKAAERRPSWQRLATLAQMEQQSGRIAEAKAHLELLLERDPGNVRGLSMLAQIELANGSPELAVDLYRRLVERSEVVPERSNLGVALLLLRRHAEAAEQFRIAVGREPGNPLYTLNLADALWLLGRRAEAEELYRRTVELAEADPQRTEPQLLTVKAQALAHLGRSVEAVAAVQEAGRRAPGDAGVAYESSLVYTLLGERASAVVSAGKALRLGYEPRWFDFPWFDGLREHPELARLLRARPPAE